ncbi:MAG: HEAT repeat domain-containing protein [Planctomycetales bacterium]|nr:HEAT repeat domain-containing protein [Planctomycetales bacterium]
MNRRILLLGALTLAMVGCAEGPLWRTGRYAPWVRSKWQEENQIALSLEAKRSTIRSLGRAAARTQHLESEQAVGRLAEILREDDSSLARIEAARALGRSRHPRAVAALAEGMQDSDPEVRIAVCAALADTQAADAINQLAMVLNSDTDRDVQLAAARGLGEFKDETAVQALVGSLDERSPALQYRVVESLRSATGEDFGSDADRWRAYANGEIPGSSPSTRFARWITNPWK